MLKRILGKLGIVRLEQRPIERLREHYAIEKALASRLRNAKRDERMRLYHELYDELYIRVPDHPQLTRKLTATDRQRAVLSQMATLKQYLTKDTCFMEIGPGDCSLSLEVAKHVRKVIAIDISDKLVTSEAIPSNFKSVLYDGININVKPSTFHLVYSNQVMEHLHPDDAVVQLRSIYEALTPGGIYICTTPNYFSGPHDISRYFDEIPTGFHLKEYTYTELYDLLKEVGFSKINAIIGHLGLYVKMPIRLFLILESLLRIAPKRIGRAISRTLIFELMLGIRIIAKK